MKRDISCHTSGKSIKLTIVKNAKVTREMRMKAFSGQLTCKPFLFCFIAKQVSSSQKISAQVQSSKRSVYLWQDVPMHIQSSRSKNSPVGSCVLQAHNCTNTVVLLMSSRCYPKGIIFSNFPSQSNCADVPGCQSEKLINKTTHNLL